MIPNLSFSSCYKVALLLSDGWEFWRIKLHLQIHLSSLYVLLSGLRRNGKSCRVKEVARLPEARAEAWYLFSSGGGNRRETSFCGGKQVSILITFKFARIISVDLEL